MKTKVKLLVTFIILLGAAMATWAFFQPHQWRLEELLLWAAVCLVSELFWLRTPSGDAVQSLASTAKLTTLLVLHPWEGILVVAGSTILGNLAFRRAKWYQALYNGSQIMLSGAGAMLLFHLFGGEFLNTTFRLDAATRSALVTDTLVSRSFWIAFLIAGPAYILINNTLMAWLISSMRERSILRLLKENSFYPAEIQSNFALILLTPLMVLSYGILGLPGLLALFLCLALVHQANRRYLAVTQAQNNLIRSERMAAMGEMAEEIGRNLGSGLDELKVKAGELLRLARNNDNDHVVKSARIIDVNVDNMSALVEGLAAFSHKETHAIPTDLNELLRRTVDFIKPQNRFDNIHFKITPDPILPLVRVDPAQMQQVFINLLANAADALAEVERPVKKIFIETHYDSEGQRIRVSLSDNGPGIPSADLDRIFEPHFTTKVTGHGFGLATVFRIAANHKGAITARNQDSGGAQFLLELPNS